MRLKWITNADKVKIIIKKSRPSVDFKQGQSVKLTIVERTELGHNALIDNTRKGVLYKDDVFQPLKKAQQIDGFIKKVRDDR